MKLKIFVTGGTFDKEYNELTGELFFKDTHLPEMLHLGRSRLDVDIRTLMMIDSLDMTAADRAIILDNCKKEPLDKIVITHGTDTMADTAKILAGSIKNKRIIQLGCCTRICANASPWCICYNEWKNFPMEQRVQKQKNWRV